MLQLSAAAILEKNNFAQDSAWLALLEIQCPDGEVIRLVQNTEDITWSDQEWIAFPFLIDSVKQSKTEVPQVPVRVGNVTRAIERFIEHYNGLVKSTVIIRVVLAKGGTRDAGGKLTLTGPPEIEETFTVQKTASNEEWATFTLGGSLPIMLRFPFTRILKDWCPFKYAKIRCGIPEWVKDTYPDCGHTLLACRERHAAAGIKVIRFGGEPGMGGGIYESNN